jgi:acetyl esterase/lipase
MDVHPSLTGAERRGIEKPMVSWLFLLVSVWGAWFTWNAYRPIYRPAWLATWSFFAGWLTAELAFHHLAVQLLATLVFAWAGAFEAWPGRIGLLVTVISWAALYRCQGGAREAERVMEAALLDALGQTYRDDVPTDLRDRLVSILDWRPLALPFRIRHREVERVRDVAYFGEGSLRLLLDVYHHRDRPSGCPVLLQIHGGAWVLGSKDEQGLPLMNHLASRGWVCFSINYRLAPRATFPDPIVDVKRAIAWIREYAAEYGGDPSFFVVTGGSAGGHLCALAALTANDPEYQPGFEHADTSVDACVSFYGVYDFTDRHSQYRHRGLTRLLERRVMKLPFATSRDAYEKASPMSRVSETAPPFLVVHGDRDTLVPVEEARHFVAALRARTKAPVAYAEIPGAQHAFEIFPSLRTALVVAGVERFLTYLYARSRGVAPAVAAERAAAGETPQAATSRR